MSSGTLSLRRKCNSWHQLRCQLLNFKSQNEKSLIPFFHLTLSVPANSVYHIFFAFSFAHFFGKETLFPKVKILNSSEYISYRLFSPELEIDQKHRLFLSFSQICFTFPWNRGWASAGCLPLIVKTALAGTKNNWAFMLQRQLIVTGTCLIAITARAVFNSAASRH